MSLMDDLRAVVRDIHQNADLNEVRFRHNGRFRKDEHQWSCRFSVRDPQKLRADDVAKLRMFADSRQLAFTDLRVLKVHPEDTVPYPGATIPWDGGTLEVLEWSQASDFTGQRVGTCVLRRP